MSAEQVAEDLTVSGRPVSTHLRDVRTISERMVGHFLETVAPCNTLPGDALGGDVAAVTRVCLELATRMLDGGEDIDAEIGRVGVAAAQWAREGIPIDTIQHAINEGVKLGFDLVLANATTSDQQSLLNVARRLMDILDTIGATVSVAYVRELKAVVSEHHAAVHTLTSALLGGNSTSTMARECGVPIADAYHVLALHIPPHRDEANPKLDPKVVARRKLRRVQAELATRCGERALSLLSIDGGTILLPANEFDDPTLDFLVKWLSDAAQVPIRATAVEAGLRRIPEAADEAHELLDIVQRLRFDSGLYRFNDMALEYQLTRPGPARDFLGSLLDPLEEYPEFFETLQMYIATNLNRQRTARLLHVHTNTVDYRLKRIGQLIDFDPTQASGLWYLRSAMVARSHRDGDFSERRVAR
ncbi:PucR family transcriptional regulator [Nocardia bhagyanarayanae]|uniref:PucR-like helix-turn-helix protein n=1 Tax=Nocardia bhagyanarayanae TaxID=1215925 RepID=A0A543FDJ5_9NOCA|nr:helix-turn-helix domain-containing protein [Nocardia bhagyanarayanae]TQM31907.1 PucR-like helix-turn-helix protein [Nocardia bhagyanarayanae]